jgi:hypothetical protein
LIHADAYSMTSRLPAGTITTSVEAKLVGKNVETVLIWNRSLATRPTSRTGTGAASLLLTVTACVPLMDTVPLTGIGSAFMTTTGVAFWSFVDASESHFPLRLRSANVS